MVTTEYHLWRIIMGDPVELKSFFVLWRHPVTIPIVYLIVLEKTLLVFI